MLGSGIDQSAKMISIEPLTSMTSPDRRAMRVSSMSFVTPRNVRVPVACVVRSLPANASGVSVIGCFNVKVAVGYVAVSSIRLLT